MCLLEHRYGKNMYYVAYKLTDIKLDENIEDCTLRMRHRNEKRAKSFGSFPILLSEFHLRVLSLNLKRFPLNKELIIH